MGLREARRGRIGRVLNYSVLAKTEKGMYLTQPSPKHVCPREFGTSLSTPT